MAVFIAWILSASLLSGNSIGTLLTTLFYVFVGCALQFVIGTGLAFLCSQPISGKNFFRVIFFIPLMVTPLGVGYAMKMVADITKGPFEPLLRGLGLENWAWSADPWAARFVMMICNSWQWIPFIFICMLAALENVPRDHVEAAQVDGASSVQIFREIIWPQIVPVAVTVLLIRTIEAFKIVDLPNIMTGGGPGSSHRVHDAQRRLRLARQRHRHLGGDRLSSSHPHRRRLRFLLQLRRARAIAESARMSAASFKFEKANRTLMERLFEPPAVGKMSPVASVVAHALLVVWSLFVLFPIYWVIITSFKDAAAVNQGPFYIPFVDFEPTLNAWRSQFNSDPFCDLPSVARQVGLLVYNSFAFIVSPVVTLQPMEPQICKIFLAFTNSIVVSIAATTVCVAIGAMAAYALARIQYKPKFGNIMMFLVLTLLVIAATSYAGVPWWASSAVALALFFFLARAFGKHFTRTLGNGDILFWIISQRILPPIVVVIPIYMMFQAVGLA